MLVTLNELDLIYEFANAYKMCLSGEVLEDDLEKYNDQLKSVNQEIFEYAKYFAKLDIEFNKNIDTNMISDLDYFLKSNHLRPSYMKINNRSWEGFWKRATGNDLYCFISYIKGSLFDPELKDKDLIKVFKEQWPSYEKVPFSVRAAEIIRKKYCNL